MICIIMNYRKFKNERIYTEKNKQLLTDTPKSSIWNIGTYHNTCIIQLDKTNTARRYKREKRRNESRKIYY